MYLRKKSIDNGSKINAGYMVIELEVFDFIEGDSTVFENEPMDKLTEMG